MFIAISGISSSGKTTVGKELASRLNLKFLDLDSFYYSRKPMVTLSNGKKVKNWDCMESLDINAFKAAILEYAPLGLVVVGFALRDDIFPIKPKYHIHLNIGDTVDDICQRCVDCRQQYKKLNLETDKMVVKELVYPFYVETLKKSKITFNIEVYYENGEGVYYKTGERLPLQKIIDMILWIIDTFSKDNITQIT